MQGFPEHSRARLQALLKAGAITVDGRVPKATERLSAGQRVVLIEPDAVGTEMVPEDIPLEVLHEDDDLIVLIKPAGMVVHPGAGCHSGTLVHALLGRELRLGAEGRGLSQIGGELRPGIVHRLDSGTSGVMVVARNDIAHRHLAKQFEVHSIERRYLAVVHRAPLHDRGTCRSELGRDPEDRLRFASVERGGRLAITHWELRTRGDRMSLLECRLETGRTHQISVHLSEAWYPLVGDRSYSRRDCTPTALIRARVEALNRPLLHAWVLGFDHPRTGERVRFQVRPPDDFLEFCQAAGLSSGLPEEEERG